MKNRAVNVIPSSYVTITTLVYALLATIFLDNVWGGEEDSGINDTNNDNKALSQELIQKPCKSPCPPNAEMCIQMCCVNYKKV